uniref:Syntaxin 18 n=1 Tax=Bos taurus TaxID=9913 RepID=A0AAA9SDT0_BOVIN
MAVDITLLFRASVKTVKTRNKALGVAVGGGVEGSRDELFRRSPRPKDDFSSRAREVISHIGKLRDFLLEHRKNYINAYSHVMSEYGRMTDTERDQIDQDAQTFMRTCSEAIQQLRTQAHKGIHSQQVKEHRTAVLDFTEDYLKRVCKLYSEQRAIRVKRVVDKKRLSKLEPEPNTKTRESMSSEKVSQSPSKDSEEKPVPEENPEAEDIKNRWQEYTEEQYKKDLHDPDNHDGVITSLEPDILECKVKWALGSITINKAIGGDEIPVELFQILKDDAVKVLHSICQQIWKPQQWPQDWKRSVFIPFPKKISGSVVSDSLQPHKSQHARPPCPSPTPGVH